MRRTHCSACGYDDLRTFLDLGFSPIADEYTAEPWGTERGYPLQVAVCTGCHLVQLLEVVDQKTLFGSGYSFYSSASQPLSAYHERYAREVIYNHSDNAGVLVEIGCNDGDMLRHFDPAKSLGVDPSGGPVEKARERGLRVINEPFTASVAEMIKSNHGPASVVIANHVLAHVESVSEVLHGVAELLGDRGVAYVEVQYLPDLLTNNAFDLVYHEHRNFFSLTSLLTAAKQWGLAPLNAQLTDRQGGSLRVKLGHQSWAAPKTNVSHILSREEWLRSPDAYGGVQGRADRIRVRLLDLISDEWAARRQVALYGAPAKATTLAHFCNLDSDTVHFALDSTPAKQGRYVPGTGIEILAPHDDRAGEPATFVVAAWNYARTIVRAHEERYGRRRWILPIPAPVIL